jgi:hypothetical protein
MSMGEPLYRFLLSLCQYVTIAFPTLGLQGSISQLWEPFRSLIPTTSSASGALQSVQGVTGDLSISPGGVYSCVRHRA